MAFHLSKHHKKKSVKLTVWMEALDGPVLQTRKPTDKSVSISAFSCNTKEIVQISIYLKSKNALV